MVRIIVFMILSMLAAKMIGILVGSESHEKKEEVEYYITAKDGVIGCLSKEKFLEEEGYYKSGNFKEAQRLLDDEECFYFKKGDKLFAAVGTCDKSHKDDEIFPFKPNEFMMLQPYLPCASVR